MADGFQLHDPIRKFSNLCVFGPMARSVEDVCLALQIISGPNDRDPEVPPLTWQEVPPLVLQDLRIAFVSTFPQTKVARDIRMAIEGFAQSLDGLCIRIEQDLPEVDLAEQVQLCNELFELMAGAFATPSEGSQPTTLDAYLLALHRRDEYIESWEHSFTKWGALICPADWLTAPLQTEQETRVDGVTIPQGQGIHPANLLRLQDILRL